MLRQLLKGVAAAGLTAGASATLYAADCGVDCDTTLRQGRVFQAWDSAVVFGDGAARRTRVWVPLLLDDGGSLLNNSVVRIVDGRILGGTSTFASVYTVMCLGTADALDSAGGFTSNDVVVFESGTLSDTVGRLLGDGSLIWRANFAAASQNGLEWTLCVPGQQTPIPEPGEGTQILAGPGIDGEPGSAFLGTPGAVEHGTNFFVGNTNFDAFSGDIPRAVNIWNYDAAVGPSPSGTPDYSYLQDDAEAFARASGVAVDAGDGRQTQPVFARVNEVYYVVFGINDTGQGGSARPAMFVVDAFADGDGFLGAVPILAPAGFHFVDHQANGGGTNVFENSHFDINSRGQIVALTESIVEPDDPNDPPTYQALLYNPVFTGDRITGYDQPIIVADAGPLDAVPEDGLVGPFSVGTPGDPNDPFEWINALSGVGTNDLGSIAFVGLYDTGEPLDPNNPEGPTRWDDAAYLYDATGATLHQVLRENDVITHDTSVLALGPIPREDSDAFMGASLADDADVLAVNFRANRDSVDGLSRGVAVVAVGHVGDVDFDADVDLSDLASLLASYNAIFMTPRYDPQADFDLDGEIGLSDLADLLARYGR